MITLRAVESDAQTLTALAAADRGSAGIHVKISKTLSNHRNLRRKSIFEPSFTGQFLDLPEKTFGQISQQIYRESAGRIPNEIHITRMLPPLRAKKRHARLFPPIFEKTLLGIGVVPFLGSGALSYRRSRQPLKDLFLSGDDSLRGSQFRLKFLRGCQRCLQSFDPILSLFA